MSENSILVHSFLVHKCAIICYVHYMTVFLHPRDKKYSHVYRTTLDMRVRGFVCINSIYKFLGGLPGLLPRLKQGAGGSAGAPVIPEWKNHAPVCFICDASLNRQYICIAGILTIS